MAATKLKESAGGFIKYWLPVIIYAILIYSISAKPGEDIPSLFAFQDVIFHILEYAGFAIMLSRALKFTSPSLNYRGRFFLVLFLAVFYALTDEWHQMSVSGRYASLVDIGYDSVGIFLANILYR